MLGVISGLVTTVFESLFTSHLCMYVPWSYPLELIVFNILFWGSFGALIGFCFWGIRFRGKSLASNEGYYWALFYLSAFTPLYVFLGNIYVGKDLRLFSLQADNFSYALIVAVPLFVVLYRKRFAAVRTSAFSFFPEIFLVVSCCWLGANFAAFLTQFKFLGMWQPVVSFVEHYSFFINLFAVATVFVVYGVGFLGNGFITKKRGAGVTLLFLLAATSAVGSLLTNRIIVSTIVPALSIKTTSQGSGTAERVAVIPNVILIVLDTARANSFSLYNAAISRPHSELRSFAKDSVVYRNCIAPSGWTAPSHASLFTGLYPVQHGVRLGEQGATFLPALGDEFVTMAEQFNDYGYMTSAIVSNRGVLGPWTNMHQGFRKYHFENGIGVIPEMYRFKSLLPLFCYVTHIRPKYFLFYQTAEDINSKLYSVLDKTAAPFFLFVNYMDAHWPYCPPRAFSHFMFPQLKKIKKNIWSFLGLVTQETGALPMELFQYNGEIAYLENQLGKLFAYLKKQHLYDSSLIIVTSDHGELIGEHGMFGHGEKVFMYEDILKVPLIIKYPGSNNVGSVEKPILLTELYPMILKTCGLSLPEDYQQIRKDLHAAPLVAEQYLLDRGRHLVLYQGRFKYLTFERGGRDEVYDIKEDPHEQKSLAAVLPEITLRMQNELHKWEETFEPMHVKGRSGNVPSAELIQGLKALGYVQ